MSGSRRVKNATTRVIGKHGSTVAFALIGAIVVAAGFFVVRDLSQTNYRAQQLHEGSGRTLNLISELQYQTQEARRIMLYALTTTETEEQINYADQSAEAEKKVTESIAQHLTGAVSEPELIAARKFESDWNVALITRREVRGAILAGNIKEAIGIDLHQGVPEFNVLREDLNEIKRTYESHSERQLAEIRASSDQSLFNLIVILCLTQLFAILAVRAVQKNKMLGVVQQSESRLRQVIESISEGMFVIGADWRVELWNGAAERSLERSRDQVVGRRLFDVFPELGNTPLPAAIEESLSRDTPTPVQYLSLLRKGDERVFEARVFPFPDGATVFINDVTDRKLAEAALRESEERYRDLVQGLDAIAWEADPATLEFTFVSQRGEAILGYPIEQWRTDPDFWTGHIHPEDRTRTVARCRAALIEGDDHEIEYRAVASDGRTVWLRDIRRVVRDHDGRIRQLRGLMVDVTAHKKMEEEILKAQKLDSIGILAGGIAHDFNNILTAVLGNISLARMLARASDKIYERLTAAERACLRARDLTQQLLTFSKGGAPVKKTTSIAELVKDSTSFALSGSSARARFEIEDGIWPVEVDEGQFSRVIQNLVINAQQAMPKGGTVRVTAENFPIGADPNLPLKPGNYVRLEIEDGGVGIPQENLNKIFDPYFTTKQKGNGLGLATAYSIVKRHEGHIAVESRVGEGTTFTIFVPAISETPLRSKEPDEPSKVAGLRILVMDDEEGIREVAAAMLAGLGCESVLAKNGQEAIHLYERARQLGHSFDAVILDLTVPGGMGGKETIEKLLELDPRVVAIVSSGYSNDPIMAEFEQYGFKGVVAKPYKLQELSNALASVSKEDLAKAV